MLPLIEDSIWKTEDELAEVYVQSMSHLYAKNLHAVKSEAAYRSNLARVDLVSQVRDTHDREIVDLDHYFEYFGGLSNAVRTARDERPEMPISDTTGEAIQTEDVRDAVTRGVRTRHLNPQVDRRDAQARLPRRPAGRPEKRGYWEATGEEMEKLRDAYLQMEGDIEESLGER